MFRAHCITNGMLYLVWQDIIVSQPPKRPQTMSLFRMIAQVHWVMGGNNDKIPLKRRSWRDLVHSSSTKLCIERHDLWDNDNINIYSKFRNLRT